MDVAAASRRARRPPTRIAHIVKILGKPSIPIPYTFGKALLKRLWAFRLTTFPAPELDHIRYVCMVDDRRAREELGYVPAMPIEETVRSVELESW
jgi:UDP-glucose 4-epimerase